ncbi:hypothetical protein DFH09DRAFT_1154306 [Mycena vulgaris]|nr:hypothetical protein DFH09DRAFT_1154306 [Mycena vulgaris]
MYFKSGTAGQPLFTADDSQAATAKATPSGVYLRPLVTDMPTPGRTRQPWYEWNYKNGVPNSLFERRNTVFIPVAPNHPLFDAFFLEAADDTLCRILWVVQFTARRHHRLKGDNEGLSNVRKLMVQAGHNQVINGYRIAVEVRWVLVTPTQADASDREWQMPSGWDTGISRNDHRGYVWLQEVDMGENNPKH